MSTDSSLEIPNSDLLGLAVSRTLAVSQPNEAATPPTNPTARTAPRTQGRFTIRRLSGGGPPDG